MKLNIYENKKIVKTYTAETYDLMFGVVEDVAEAVNLDELKSGTDAEILKLIGGLVLKSMGTIRGLLLDIFDGLTEEEVKHTKVKEVAQVLLDVVKFTIVQLNLGTDSKN